MRFWLFIILTGLAAMPVAAASYTSSQNGNWSSASTWGGAGVPGVGDTATVQNTVTLDIQVTVATLNVTGTLTGSQGITITSAFNWNGGTLSGSGSIAIPSGATMTVGGGGFLDARPLTIAGTLNITGSNYFYMQNNAVLTNSGTINYQGDGGIYMNGTIGTTSVVNNGTIEKSGGTGVSNLTVPLTAQNGSQLLAQSATFNVAAVSSTGATFSASSGATLDFNTSDTRTFDSTSTLSGLGTIQFGFGTNTVNATYNVTGTTTNSGATTTITNITSVGNITMTGGTLTLNSASTVSVPALTMQGGTLNGTAPITITGAAMTWTGGTIAGSRTLTISNSTAIAVNGAVTFDTLSISNSGTLTYANGDYSYFYNSATLNNGGTIDFQGDCGFYIGSGSPSITNSGTIKKSAGTTSGTFQVTLTVTSGGQVQVESTTLYFGNASFTGGTLTVTSGATAYFYYSTSVTFDAASTISGAGTVNWGAGTDTINAAYNITGSTINSGATTTLNNITNLGTVTNSGGTLTANSVPNGGAGNVTVSGGTLTLNSAAGLSIPQLVMSGGTLSGTASIALTGTTMTWTAGTIAGSGSFTIPNTTTITVNGYLNFDTRAISNAGTINYTGGYYAYFYNSATLTNSGTIDFQGDMSYYIGSGSPSVMNSGTIKKSAGTGSGGSFQVPLVAQSGSQLLIQSGTLYLGNVTSTGSTLSVVAGATAYFYYTTTANFDAASTISGAGTINWAAGTETVNASYDITGTTMNSGATTTLGNVTSVGNVTNTGGTLTIGSVPSGGIGNITAQGGTLVLNNATALSIPQLVMSGGILSGTAPINITGTSMTWTGGTLGGSGALTIPNTTAITINGYVNFDTRTVNNAGTINYTGAYYGYFYNGATFNNSGTVDFQGDMVWYIGSGSPSVVNSGTIKKSAGTGSGGALQVALTAQSGSQLLLQSGTLYLGNFTSTGSTFSVASGTTALFYYATSVSFDAASTIGGAGTVNWAAGTDTINGIYNITGATLNSGATTTLNNVTSVGNVTVTGGTLTVNSVPAAGISNVTAQGGTVVLNNATALNIAQLVMSGGTLGGTAPINITGTSMTWTGGTIGGSGSLSIPNGTTITIGGYVNFDTRAITNAGVMNYTGGYYAYFYNSATLTNSGSINFQGDMSYYIGSGSPGVTNSGTITYAGSATATFQVALIQQTGAQFLVQSGAVYVGNVTSTGATVNVASGANIFFYYTTTATFDAASTISGAGGVNWRSGTNTVNGTYNVTGSTATAGGTTTLNSITSVGSLTIGGGTLTLNSASVVSTPSLATSGGTLNGTAPVTITGPSSAWSGATFGGSGTLSVPVGTTITIAANVTIDGRPVTNAGTFNFVSGGQLVMQNNGTLTNSGTIDLQCDCSLLLTGSAGTTAIINSGTLKKSVGTFSSTINIPYTAQSGSQLLLQTASLYFGAITSNGGTFNFASGTNIYFNSSDARTFDAASTISGSGTTNWQAGTNSIAGTITTPMLVSGGTTAINSATTQSIPTLTMQGGIFNGTGNVSLTGAAMSWTGGTIGGTGTLTIPVATTITIASGVVLDTRPVTNNGTIAITSTNYFYMDNNAVLTNNGTIDIQGDGNIYLFGSAGTTAIANNATIKKSGGTSTTTISVPLDAQSGSQFLAQSGTTDVYAVTSTGGTFNVTSGAALVFISGDTRTFDAASTISGAGNVTFSNGTSTFAGTISTATTVNGGTLTINSAATQVFPSLTMQGGTLNGSGNINIGSGAIITSVGPNPVGEAAVATKHGRAARPQPGKGLQPIITGTSTTWTGGTLGGSGTIIITSGNSVTISGAIVLDTKPMTNSGTLSLAGSSYVSMQNGAALTNGGTITFQADSSAFYVGAGAATITNDGTLIKSGGTGSSYVYPAFTNNAGGTVEPASGTIYFNQPPANNGTLYFPIAGATSFGKLQVNGALPLGGTLTVTTTGGYAPATGTAFQILTYSSTSGAFTTTNLDYATGSFTPTFAATSLTVTAGAQALGITGVSPSLGGIAGGTTVAITGVDFASGATVTFGGTAAASVTFNNSTSLTAVTPAHVVGPVDVVVTNPSTQFATLSKGFTFTGLVAQYSFETAGTPGKDASGNGYDSTNVVGVTEVTGKVGQAGSFSSGYMDLPLASALNLRSSDFTLEAWVNSSSTANNNWFTKATNSVQQYGLGTFNSTQVQFSFDGGTGGSVNSTSTVFDGTWHHVAAVKRGTTAELWIDGVMQGSTTVSGSSDLGAFAIGRDGACCDSFNGLIDEAKIYNLALTSTQIQTDALASDVALTQTATAAVTVGQPITYTIGITNNGPSTATGVNVTDVLPAGVSYVSASATQGSCSGSATISCIAGTLANGGTATVTIVVNATTSGTITNTASASHNESDTVAANNSASASTTVTAGSCTPPAVTASGPTTFCAGGSVTLTASAPGATGLQWYLNNASISGATATTYSPVASGSYTVTATFPNACTATSAATSVTINPNPATPAITASGPATFCAGGSVTLTASTISGVTYAWSNGATTQAITVNTSGNYSVTVTNGSGCNSTSAAANVTVNPNPTATISAPASACANVSTTASVTNIAGATFNWTASNASITFGQGSNSINFTPTGAGNVALAVTVTDANGCTASANANVTVGAFTPAITPSGPTTFCSGGSVTLTATAGTSYSWSTGATTQSITVNSAGTYSVTVASGGCSGTSAPVTVTVNTPPTATVTASGPTNFCSGGSVTLTASAGANWLWSNGATTRSIVATTTGSYGVTVTNAQGCSATSGATAVNVAASPTATITGPTSTCPNATITLDAGAGFTSYAWSTGATTRTISASPAATTTYSVTVTNNFSCSASASQTVTVTTAPAATITAPASVCPNSTNNNASTAVTAGATYAWTISGGAITGGQGTNAIAFSAANSGNVQLGVTVTSGACSATGSATSAISQNAAVSITAPSSVPPSSANNSASVPAGPAGTTYNWSLTGGTITAGQGTSSITWTAASSGNVSINVTVTSSGGCTATGSTTVAIGSNADLSVSLSAPASVNSGAPFSIVVTVANAGPTTAQNVTVTNALPSGVAFNGATGAGWSCSAPSNVICTMPSLGAGTASAITINLTAPAGPAALTDSATVTSASGDPNSANNSASATTRVTAATPQCGSTPASLLTPASAATLQNPINFTWTSVPNASAYELWINNALATATSTTSASLSLPAGPQSWFVVAKFSTTCAPLVSATQTFTVAQAANCNHGSAQLNAPLPGAVVASPVTFQWTAVPEATGYRVWVAIDGGAAQDIGTTNGAISFSAPLTGTNVVWFVEAIFNGCPTTKSSTSSFTPASIDPCAGHTAATPTAPADKSATQSSNVQFSWSAVANANGYRVWAKLAGAADFTALGTTTTDTTLTATIAGNGNVEWYVQALFDGCPGIESTHFNFTIVPPQACPTAPATIAAPANGSTVNTTSVQFTWNAAQNAIGYEVWLSLANAAPSLLGTTTSTSLTHEVPPGALEWFVRTNFNGCPPADSAHATFTVTLPPNCTTQRPLLSKPADDDHVVIPVDFAWSPVPNATQYKVWVARNHGAFALQGTTTNTHLDAQTLDAGAIDWYIEAIFGNACGSTQSAAGSFVAVPAPAPCAPAVSPALRTGSQASSNVTYVISWNRIGNAAFYEYEESTSADFINATPSDTNADHVSFKHANTTPSPVAYFYRVRMVSQCDGSLSLFSPAIAVVILPEIGGMGATPADNPQPISYVINVGGTAPAAIPAQPGQTFSAVANQPWITINPPSGTVPDGGIQLTVTANATALPVGTSTGAVTILLGSVSGKLGTTGGSSSTTTVSVNLVQPSTPSTKSAPPPDALIIPAVAHADGLNSKFQSDVRVTNTAADVKKYQITFTPTGDAGAQSGKQATVSIDPGATLALDDILTAWFGAGASAQGAIGTLEIRPTSAGTTATSPSSPAASSTGIPSITTFAASRTFNTTANGTFGQYIPAIPFAQFVGSKGSVLSLQQIAQSQAYRTNVGLVEGSGEPATVLLSVFGDDGTKLAEFTQALSGGQHIQLNGVLAAHNLSMNDGRIEVKVTSAGGKVTAYASVVDNATNDPLLVSPVQVGALGGTKWVIPGVADLSNGVANWRSDVRLFNAGTTSVNATLTYVPQDGSTPSVKTVTIAPNAVTQLDGILQSTFGITNSGGALQIATAAGAPLVATARTYNQTSNGTYGQFIPAVTPDDAVGKGQRALQILQIEESDRFRSNIGIAEVTGNPATVELTAVPPDSKTAVTTRTTLNANQFIQYGSLLRSMGLGDTYNARVTVRVIDGSGKVTAYASVIDQKTQDPTFVPAQ